jgi:BirA family biotin operon repressor/biotin-[acetyl-CoA-carboxylase] ligase
MIDRQAQVEVFDEIDSTMLEARRRAEKGDTRPMWLVAKRQTAGRGRRGRTWASLEGNLMATYLFETDQPPAQVALLGFAAGVAIAETFDAALGPGRATLKWPNDVMIDGAKAAGILLDSGTTAPGRLWAALAFGVNLATAPTGLDQRTICLRDVLSSDAAPPSPLSFLAQVRPLLEAWAERLASEGFQPLRDAWLGRAHGMGQAALVRQGEQSLEGRIAGLTERGELELETVSGRRLIAAGDIFFPNAA